MKTLLSITLFALGTVSPIPMSSAETQSVQRSENKASTDTSSSGGNYVGSWNGGADSGQLRLRLTRDDNVWSAEVKFTFQGEEISTKVLSTKFDGAKIELVFAWEVQGTPGQSQLRGEAKGDGLEGTYENKTPDGTTSGTWSVTRS